MAEYLVFQKNKVETIKTPSLLQQLNILGQCWEEVLMDFIISVTKSKGNNVIMVVIDRLTKYAHFVSLSHPFCASTIVATFMDTIQKLHGYPKIILSDRDPIFMGKKIELNYFLVWGPNWLTINLIILNMMGKQK